MMLQHYNFCGQMQPFLLVSNPCRRMASISLFACFHQCNDHLGAGDFGEEAISLVKQIAQVTVPKAVILGNHDAW